MWVALVVVTVGVMVALLVSWRLLVRARRSIVPAEPLPLVLVHGYLGFDELKLLGRRQPYFRGIARALEELGAEVHVVKLPAMASVPERAAELARAIRALDAPRVNIVAHSMGGVDARYAISKLGLADRVASLVTIGTPHRGTPLASLGRLPPLAVARAGLSTLGLRCDGSDCLTPQAMQLFNETITNVEGVHYASVIGRARGGRTTVTRPLMRRAGSSDGIVPASSQVWGHVILETEADHWAQIGWSRRDVRPIYRAIAEHLRAQGL